MRAGDRTGNNAAGRGMRAIALGRTNCHLVGSEAGDSAAAIAYTPTESALIRALLNHVVQVP